MNDIIKSKLNNLSVNSGVYIMKDETGTVIYVGKAKNLKNRVSQYFNDGKKLPKVQAMVDHIADFEYFLTLSEMDAFALENNLIKKYQPFYNILLKDAKTFAYIKVNLKEDFPTFEVTRKLKKDGSKYFGPYITGVSARDVLTLLNMAFPVRKCKEKMSKKRTRACLNYNIGLCKAPCMGYIDKEEYRKIVDSAVDFLKGNDQEVERILLQKMNNFASVENFEKALEMRDYLKIVKKLKEKVVANLPKNLSIDAFAYVSDGEAGAVCVTNIRGGKILGVKDYSITDGAISDQETMADFILEYYKLNEMPDEVLTNISLDDQQETIEYLSGMFNKKVSIIVPKIAVKSSIIKMAEQNAQEHLFKRVREDKLKFKRTLGALINLKDILGLEKLPKRMECFDISNISGTNSVSSMVVFINGEPARKMYRKFKIKTVDGPNDYASHKETLTRRLGELEKGEDESFSQMPDLIIIDGGKGQLSVTYSVLQNSRFKNIKMIGLAEKFEEIFLPNQSTPLMLKRSSEELKLLQRIRDEAHRFAITYHRNLRGKSQVADPLDNVKGIGKVKRQILYASFKSLEKIKKASIDELKLVKGITEDNAKAIREFFDNNDK